MTLMMDEWLSNPVIQSGVVPFVAALIVAIVFKYLRLSGLAVIAGFAATVYLVADFNFESLTIVKKIILSGLIAAAIAPLLDLIANYVRLVRHLVVITSGCVVVWVFWSVLQQKTLTDAALHGAGLVSYSMMLALLMDRLAWTSTRAGPAGLSLGIATGCLALLGASALLGQLGFSLGMACAAYTLYSLISGKVLSCGRSFTFSMSLLCGLIAPAAMILAKLPWYGLPLLLIVPFAAQLPLPASWSMRWQLVLLLMVTLIAGAIPVFLVGHFSGELLF